MKQQPQTAPADFRIAADGTWFHNGERIKREALAKLFSDRALKIDAEGRYWLQTPFEKYPVEVEEVPFLIVDYEKQADGYDFLTNMGERVVVGPDHPLELRDNIPYIEVRDGLYAKMGRAVYYNLIEQEGSEIKSRGVNYKLGEMHD